MLMGSPASIEHNVHRPASAETDVILSVVTPAPRPVWQKLMRSDPLAVPYQCPEWTDAAVGTGRYIDVSRCYTFKSGAQFVLPMITGNGRPKWASIAGSMPNAWGMGGLVGTEQPTLPVLQAILSDLRTLGYLGIHLRPNPLQAPIWAAARPGQPTPRRAHVLDLSGGFDSVWHKFPTGLRTKIRKAERITEIEFDGSGRLLPVFFNLLDMSQARWARSQHEPVALARWRADRRDPKQKFEQIASAMPGACQVGVARLNGHPVASILVLVGTNANHSRGAMDAERIGSTGANELLLRHAIEHAALAGCRSFHMGETGKSRSLSQYKEKFGAVPHDYFEYRLEKIPVARIEKAAKSIIKRSIGFKEKS